MRLRSLRMTSVAAGLLLLGVPGLAAAAEEGPTPTDIAVNSMWVVLGAILVLFMQAGFAMLEIGLSRMKNAGALLQLDASGLTGADGPNTDVEARRLLREGLIDLIGSDGHGERSPVRLDIARDMAAAVIGEAAATRLVDGSALGL